MEGIFVVVCILVVLFVVFDQLHLRKQRRQSSSFPTRGSVRQSIDSRNQTSRPSDVTIDMLEGMPYGWVSTAIGGSEPQQMVRAMQTSGMSQLDALAQMCEAGFDAFCRSLADTANVRGAAGYYKGRERDLYKTNLLKVIAEHYGRPMAEQVIDRLEPPVPTPTVREPPRTNPTPADGISADTQLERIILGWFEFTFTSAEGEQELRRLEQSGFTAVVALATMCTRGYEESFCPGVVTRASASGCEHLFQGRERDLFEMHAISFMRDTYGFDIGNEVGALLLQDRLQTEFLTDIDLQDRLQTEFLTDIDHPTYGGPGALFRVNSAIQEELAREWAILLADSGLVAPSARDQLILLAKEFYETRGSGSLYDTYCRKYRAMADSTGVLEHFQPHELTYFRIGCSNIFQEMYGLDFAQSVVPEDIPRLDLPED